MNKKLTQRHYAFAGLFLVVFVAMIAGFSFPVAVSDATKKMYAFVDSIPENSTLIISFDHEASSLPEISPLTNAVLRHCFQQGHRLIGLALLAEGTGIGYQAMKQTATEFGREYGKEYVFLGFKPQQTAAILGMGESIKGTWPSDYLGTPSDSLKLLDSIRNYGDVAAVISIADGNLTTHWIEYGHARFNVSIWGAVTAAMMTAYDPYLSSGQLAGMIGGLRQAAEYEQLLDTPGAGGRGMVAQSVSHLYVLLMIAVGNLIYFVSRRSKGGK